MNEVSPMKLKEKIGTPPPNSSSFRATPLRWSMFGSCVQSWPP